MPAAVGIRAPAAVAQLAANFASGFPFFALDFPVTFTDFTPGAVT